MDVLNYIKTKNYVNPDYNKIKPIISEMISSSIIVNEKKEKQNKYKYLKLAFYTLFICLVSVLSTVLIQKNNTATPLNTDMGKDSYLVATTPVSNNEPIFDLIIAWGPEAASATFKLDVILNSNLLSKSDKEILTEYAKEEKKANSNSIIEFQVCFGMKNNQDLIYLIDYNSVSLGTKEKCINKTFIFKSNLSYSFLSIIDEFEELIDEKLSNEFLNESYYDAQNLLKTGIILEFIESDNGLFQEYYIMKYNNKLYTIIGERIQLVIE